MLFPDVGYTYIINLDTPFTMKIDNDAFELKSDAFIPRYKNITATHSSGNKLFCIKFKVSLVIRRRSISQSMLLYIFPLAYLINRTIVEKVKLAPSFVKPSGLPENNSIGFTRF